MRPLALGLVLLALATPLRAALTQAQLDTVRASPARDARFDPGTGLPTVLLFADFDCGALCNAILGQTATTLSGSGLKLGEDYALVVIGIDPRDGPDAARHFVSAQSAPLSPEEIDWRRPDATALHRMTEALGYHFLYDEEKERFAHPSVRYVLTAEGRVSRVLPAFRAEPEDLRRALVEAGNGQVGTIVERVALACYGFDPATGTYSLSILRTATVLGVAGTFLLGGGILTALYRERRRAAR